MNALRNNGLDGHSSGSYEPPPKRSRTATFQPCKGDHCSLSCQIADILSVIEVMKVQQATTYKSFHYLEQTKVSAEDRKALCQWGFDIMDACKLNHDVAIIAIGYFDRFLSKRGLPVVEACLDNQREFQLAFVVSPHHEMLVFLSLDPNAYHASTFSCDFIDLPCIGLKGTCRHGNRAKICG